jgi:cation transport ATPase
MKTGTALQSKGEIKILHAVAGRVRLGFVDSPTKKVTNTVIKQLRQQEEKVIYQIVHSTPGRLRVRIPRIRWDCAYNQRLEALAAADAKISSIRLKSSAASVTIRYQTKLLKQAESRDYIASLIQLAGNPKIANLKSKAQPEQPKQISYWSALKFPTLATLLSILGGPVGLWISPVVVGGSIVLAALPIARRAMETIVEQRRINIDFLDLTAIAIARNAKEIINQNAGIVALPNLSGLAIAATVGMNPMTATLINNGSSVIAGMNGLRPVITGS